MHQWLSTGRKGEDSFSKREFSFTLANDIYIPCSSAGSTQCLFLSGQS